MSSIYAGLFALTEQRLGHLGKPVTSWVMCPTCRQHTDYRNIAYAVDMENKSDDPFDASENSEASITVRGSYSTKVFYYSTYDCNKCVKAVFKLRDFPFQKHSA